MASKKIISYNLNGIRAAISKEIISWFDLRKPDLVCMQEIKLSEDKLLDIGDIEDLEYFKYWNFSKRKGYSGVAIFSKQEPKDVVYETKVSILDEESRFIKLVFDEFAIISLYVPSASNIDRLNYKMEFLRAFESYIYSLKKNNDKIIISGDYNICHKPIDIHDPIGNKNSSGFLPIEREWLDNFIKSGFVDSFRHFNPSPHNYSWWSYRTRARDRNKGWRIDYNLVSDKLKDMLKDAYILKGDNHSDHCPVVLEMDFS